MATKVVHYLNPVFAKSNQIVKKNNQLISEFYTMPLNQSFVVYEFVCLKCSANYIAKTERTLFKINVKHAWSDKDSVVNIHLNEWNGVQRMFNIAKSTPSLFPDRIAV